MKDLKDALTLIDTLAENPSKGLPEELFLFVSRMTPLVNVDLLIKNGRGETLLTWRDDGYWKAGWHIPGGIIRYKERMADRIAAVARQELGAQVQFEEAPLAVNELLHPERAERGHFISFLFRCALVSAPDSRLECRSDEPQPGQWRWHATCPDNIITVHEIYRGFM